MGGIIILIGVGMILISKTEKNVANSTRKDMLNQMKAVRSIPTSASATNSAGTEETDHNKLVFKALSEIDGGVDNLFG